MNDAAILIGAVLTGVIICLIAGWVVNRIDASETRESFTIIDDDEDDYIGAD